MDNAAERGKNNTVAAIGAGIVITGDVASTVELQIGGRVNGDVHCQTLFVDEGGIVTGTVKAERVRLSGTVDGTIDTTDLAIEPTGRMSGAVTYARLKVSPGGVMEGTMTHRAADLSAATISEPSSLKLVEAAAERAAATPRRVYGE